MGAYDPDQDGFELGSWVLDTDSGLLNITVTADTNNGAGVAGGPGSVSLPVNFTSSDLSLVVEEGEIVLSKLEIDVDKPEVGSWVHLSFAGDGTLEDFSITNFFVSGLFTALDYSLTDAPERYITAGSYTFDGEQLSVFDFTAWTNTGSEPEGSTEALQANIDGTLTLSGVDEGGGWSDVLYLLG